MTDTNPSTPEMTEKEKEFLSKFSDRVKMWYETHINRQGNLTAPLPIVMAPDGSPIWLNRKLRRSLEPRKAKKLW